MHNPFYNITRKASLLLNMWSFSPRALYSCLSASLLGWSLNYNELSVVLHFPFCFLRIDSSGSLGPSHTHMGFHHLIPNPNPAEKEHLDPLCGKIKGCCPLFLGNCSLEVRVGGSEDQLILPSLSQSQLLPTADLSHEPAPRGSTEEKQSKEVAWSPPNPRAPQCPPPPCPSLGSAWPPKDRDTR